MKIDGSKALKGRKLVISSQFIGNTHHVSSPSRNGAYHHSLFEL